MIDVPLWLAVLGANAMGLCAGLAVWLVMRRRNRRLRARADAIRAGMRKPLAIASTLSELLPPPDADFAELKREAVAPPRARVRGTRKAALANHSALLAQEFAGRPRILHIHALAIAILRRPFRWITPHARWIFIRLWREEAAYLCDALSLRWLGSAAATFAEHGVSLESRRLGHVAITLIEMVKLYESERRYAGADALSMARRRPTEDTEMFDGITRYALDGDLIENMEARLLSAIEAAETSSDLDGCPVLVREIWRRLGAETTVIGRFEAMRAPLAGLEP